jgi:tetratricopeptide (TPR) repeat protein
MRKKHQQAFVLLFVGCLSAALLLLAVPRLMGALAMLPGDNGLEQLRAGRQITLGGIERLLDSRRAALGWVDDAEAHRDIGAVLLALASSDIPRATCNDELAERAKDEFLRGLALAPVQAEGWDLLVTAELGLGDVQEAVQALRLSYRSNPHAGSLARVRTPKAMLLWDDLDAPLRAQVQRELRSLFRREPRAAIDAAIHAQGLKVLREALQDDQAALQRLEKIVKSLETARS